MQKLLLVIAALCLVAAPGFAQGTLYQQEGSGTDGNAGINATGQGPAGDSSDNWTNWKWQAGSGSWSGVYTAVPGDAWMTATQSGDPSIKVEADIEMYFMEQISNNEVYFHIGNPFAATTADKTAYVDGTFSSNNGQYIGISFDNLGKVAADFEQVGGALTGRIFNGMQSDRHVYGTQNQSFDIEFAMSWGSGWQPPVGFGAGAHGTYQSTLWWLVGGGAPGTYSYQWRIRLLCDALQPDGDYYLDPVVVAAPLL